MITIGFGQNVIDHYYDENEYVGSSAGGSVWNIVSNIASLGGKTFALGCLAGDQAGDIFIEEMKQLGVDVSLMDIKSKQKSNAMFIELQNKYKFYNEVKASYKCPICGKSHWKSRKSIDCLQYSSFKNQDILFVVDNIKSENIEAIRKLKDCASTLIVAQDLGHKYNLRFKKDYELVNYFSNIDIMQIKEDVIKFLLNRMNTTINDFMIVCNIKRIIVTNGAEGCYIHDSFQNNYIVKKYTPSKIYNAIDPSGAGDVFFARYLYKTVVCQKTNNVEEIFEFCQKGVEKVVDGVGAKYNLGIQLHNIEIAGRCDCVNLKSCGNLSEKVSRKFKCLANYEAVQKQLQTIRLSYDERFKQIFRQKGAVICIGTGASYITAVYISDLLVEMGKLSIAIYPYEIKEYCHTDIGQILIFTASGKTYDNIKLANDCIGLFNRATIRLVTTADRKALEENYPMEIVENSIIYNSEYKYREEGFLSFWGVFGPIVYFTLFIRNQDDANDILLKKIIQRFKYWDNDQEICRCVNELLEKECKTIDIIYSAKYKAAAIAMESMLTESGTYRCLLHEEKNFSHGRFITSEHIPSSGTIIIKGRETTEYENKLIEYIKNQAHLLWVLCPETKYSKIDAIIAIYSWLVQYSLKNNRDISKPEYTNDSMKLYKFK